ncbi:MAG: AAA family ATPase [Anaerolineales bacterium]|nr:AAA family ATPase [Anaerolineales bacterium]
MNEFSLAELLDSIGPNTNFKLFPYYAKCFDLIPSTIKIHLQEDGTQEKATKILEELDLGKYAFEPVLKNWRTENSKDAQPSEDFVYEYVFKSESHQMLIHFLAQRNFIQIHFLYNLHDLETEKWILEVNHSLRAKYGSEKKPGFKVLVSSEGRFYTDDIDTIDFESVDINELYNDDFVEVDQIISQSLQKNESGMILLHGEPGTGKTTYIKHLICKHTDKQFIFIQNDFVRDLLNPSFVFFLLQNKNSILLIEDAEKVVISRESSSNDSVVSTILQLTDGLFSDYLNIKIICTFNTNIERIDKALLRKGRMIAKYKFTALSADKTQALATKMGFENVTGSMTLADIFGADKKDFKDAEKKAIGFSD